MRIHAHHDGQVHQTYQQEGRNFQHFYWKIQISIKLEKCIPHFLYQCEFVAIFLMQEIRKFCLNFINDFYSMVQTATFAKHHYRAALLFPFKILGKEISVEKVETEVPNFVFLIFLLQ